MLKYRLRPAELPDLAQCLEIDASYVTNHVWQLEERFERVDKEAPLVRASSNPGPKIVGKSSSSGPDEFHISFRPTRLPRTLAVPSPLSEEQLLTQWKQTDFLILAETLPEEVVNLAGEEQRVQAEILGYIGLHLNSDRHLTWITSLAVNLNYRRQGIGKALLAEALEWADRNRLRSVMVEIQTKNYPAINFLQKNNFFFCGYNTAYYVHREIALFFGRRLERLV